MELIVLSFGLIAAIWAIYYIFCGMAAIGTNRSLIFIVVVSVCLMIFFPWGLPIWFFIEGVASKHNEKETNT